MPVLTLTNQVASQSLRGESVKVTLNESDSQQLPNLQVGMLCVNSDSFPKKIGYISSVDYFGNSFGITPVQPDRTFGEIGYSFDDDQINVYYDGSFVFFTTEEVQVGNTGFRITLYVLDDGGVNATGQIFWGDGFTNFDIATGDGFGNQWAYNSGQSYNGFVFFDNPERISSIVIDIND